MPKVFLLFVLTAIAPRPAAAADLDKLAWLQGTWTGTKDGTYMEEIWSAPTGGGLVGMHKDSKGGRMTSYEFFRVVPDDSGRVCYLASPLGRSPMPFCAIEVGAARVVFENREHDFPQRILYWMDQGHLHARIEGKIQGKEQSEEWAWVRAKGN